MIKILELSTVHPFPDSRIFYKYSLGLSQKGYVIVSTGVGKLCDAQLLDTPTNLSVIRIQSINNKFGRAIFGFFVSFVIILRHRPDVVHYHDPELFFVGILKWFFKFKLIFDCHESLPLQFLNKGKKNRWGKGKSLLGFLAVRLNSIFTDFVVSATEGISHDFNFPSVVIKNYPTESFVDELHQKLVANESKSEVIRICYVGAYLDSNRGAELILELAHRLAKKSLNVEIVIAARVTPRLKEKFDIHSNIKYMGFLSRDEILDVYIKCDIGILIEDYSENHLIALPIKLFEYAAAGLFVICTDIPLWKEIVEDHDFGITVKFGDVDAIFHIVENYKRHSKSKVLNQNRAVKLNYIFERQLHDLEKLFN